MPRFEELHVTNQVASNGDGIYKPVRQEGNIFHYVNPSRHLLTAVRPRISIATIGTGPKGGIERNTIKVVLPFPKQDAAGNDLNEKSHELVAFVSFSIPTKSTQDERIELLREVIGALQATRDGESTTVPVMAQILMHNEALF